MFIAPEVFIIGMLIVGGGTVQKTLVEPPESELQRFIRYASPDATDEWVRWQQNGAFAGHEAETYTGRNLLAFRASVPALAGAPPNFCALSKAATAASFAARHGGAPEDYAGSVAKYSRCRE